MTDLASALKALIKEAVREGIREELAGTGVQLMSVRQTADKLALSKSEIYNMLSRGELTLVTQGKRKLIDARSVTEWMNHHINNRLLIK